MLRRASPWGAAFRNRSNCGRPAAVHPRGGRQPPRLRRSSVMDGKPEVNLSKFVGRHLSQLKILSRVLEHELESAKGAREVQIDRQLIENALDTLEIFTDDCENVTGFSRERKVEPKAVVGRLN
jgi:hypothetical protein